MIIELWEVQKRKANYKSGKDKNTYIHLHTEDEKTISQVCGNHFLVSIKPNLIES